METQRYANATLLFWSTPLWRRLTSPADSHWHPFMKTGWKPVIVDVKAIWRLIVTKAWKVEWKEKVWKWKCLTCCLGRIVKRGLLSNLVDSFIVLNHSWTRDFTNGSSNVREKELLLSTSKSKFSIKFNFIIDLLKTKVSWGPVWYIFLLFFPPTVDNLTTSFLEMRFHFYCRLLHI